jgi:hypothetical protein
MGAHATSLLAPAPLVLRAHEPWRGAPALPRQHTFYTAARAAGANRCTMHHQQVAKDARTQKN